MRLVKSINAVCGYGGGRYSAGISIYKMAQSQIPSLRLDGGGGSNLLIHTSEKPVLRPAVVWDGFRL